MYQAVRATITLPQMDHQVRRPDATKACSASIVCREDSADGLPPRGLMLLSRVHRPCKMRRRSQMLTANLRAGLFDFLQQDPLVHTGSCSLDLRDLPTKPVRLRRVRIVQGSRANRLQDDHDGLGLLRGFSGIREQLFAGTRKGRWARSGQATRGQVKPWAGSGQTTWKRAPDAIRSSFDDLSKWSYLSYEMPRETR